MLIPVGEAVSVPVGVVVLRGEPEIWSAVLVRLDNDTLRLQITSPPNVRAEPGVRLIVHADRTKLPGRVLAIEGDELVVSRDRAPPTDDRAAPRVMSHLSLRWRVSNADRRSEAEAWLAGGPDPGPFVVFRGGASLSMSGMRFDAKSVAPGVGAELLVELQLGGEPWRARAAVRRVDEDNGATAIGVEFLELPESTFDALSEFTLRNL
jgi:hypothetical protein